MEAHSAQPMPFNAKIEGIRADSEDKERILLEVLAEVRSAFTAGAITSAEFDRLTSRGLMRMHEFGL